MVTSLIQHERILTTHTKAKYAQRYAEKMVAFAKDGQDQTSHHSDRLPKMKHSTMSILTFLLSSFSLYSLVLFLS